MSNSLPRKAGGAVAMAPGRREDLVGQCGPSRAQGIWRPPRACTLLGEARPGAPPAWRASQGVGASPASRRGNGVLARPFPGRGSSVMRSARLNKENRGSRPAVSPPGAGQRETEQSRFL